MQGRKDISRYDSDFYIEMNTSQYFLLSDNLSFVNKDNDFSISFFIVPDSQTTDRYVISCRNGIGGDGWSVRYHDNRLKFQTDIGGFTQYTFTHSFNTNSFNHVLLNYDSATRDMTCYIDSVLVGTENIANIEFANAGTETYFGARDNVNTSLSFEGGIRNIGVFSRILEYDEIQYIYYKGGLEREFFTETEKYYPLNDRAYDLAGDFFLKDCSEEINTSSSGGDVQAIGWTDSELGVTDHNTATAYKDYVTKATTIIPKGYNLGLNFVRTNQQYLSVTGLEVFDKAEGYTFLTGIESELGATGQYYVWSFEGNEGPTQSYRMFKSSGFTRYALNYPFIGGSGVRNPSPGFSYDVQNRHLVSMRCTPDTSLRNPYNATDQVVNGSLGVNGNSGYLNITDGPISLGFDELTSPDFHIGRRAGSSFFGGKISYFVVYKGIMAQEEIKRCYNNGVFRSPYDALTDTSKIILDIDFSSPFENGADIEFPDNSGNCTVVAIQNSGTEWDTLAGVQASID